jgi:hypothetical protein
MLESGNDPEIINSIRPVRVTEITSFSPDNFQKKFKKNNIKEFAVSAECKRYHSGYFLV